MENNGLKKKQYKKRICYYFDDINILEDSDLDNVLIDKKSHKNMLIYNMLYKTLIGLKPSRIRFDKIDGFIRIYDGTRYLKLFGSENYHAINNRIRYLISPKSSITYSFSHSFAKIKIDSYDSLPVEKRLRLHNVTILIK